jgi:hypothetical protein
MTGPGSPQELPPQPEIEGDVFFLGHIATFKSMISWCIKYLRANPPFKFQDLSRTHDKTQ